MKYEVMVIIGNDLNEKEAEKHATDAVVQKIKELKGNISFEDFWGARGFAYKIKKQTWGYYFVAQFEIDSEKIPELKKEWNLDKKIIRFLIAKVDPKAPAPRPYAEQKKEWDVMSRKQKEEENPEEEKTAPDSAQEKETETKESEPESKEKKSDVDRKLNEILEDSSLDL